MNRVLLILLAGLLAAPVSAQVRFSVGALAGSENTFSGRPEVGLAINGAAHWRRLLVQAHVADVATGTYNIVRTPGGPVVQERYVNVAVALDAHYVQPLVGLVSATLGAGVISTRFDEVRRPIPNEAWSTIYRLYVGGIVGAPDRVRLQARVALTPYSDRLDLGRTQVGVLVPLKL